MADNTLKKIDKFSFSLKDVIGVGSFGKVFKGKNEKNQDLVAVKMMDKKKIQSDEYLMQGLFSEIQVMKKLKSEYVVELNEVLETSNNYYIIQEFCDGGDFRHVLKKRKFLPEQEAVQVLKDLLSGFTELLKHGIIHRDLKPENILVANGKYKLADFGFSRTVDNFKKQMLESLVGTPLYMSPQILKHENYTTKSDIWSLALIYYEMLYGQTPWQARSQYELVQNIENKNVEFQDKIQMVSKESKDFINACLQKREDDRISWDDIFKHNLFQGYFNDYIKKRGELENKAIFIINNLRQKIYQERLDLENLFAKYGLQQKSRMNAKEFSNMMMEIDNTLTRQQIEYIFNKFDENGDLTIDFDEFKNWLEQNNVRMSMRGSGATNPSAVQRINTKYITKEIEEKAQKAIIKLKESINTHNINLQLLFSQFNRNDQDKLSVNEFADLIKKVDDKLGNEEIDATFKKFDTDGDGFITFKDFCTSLAQSTGYQLQTSNTNYSTNDTPVQMQQVNYQHPNANNIAMLNQQGNMYNQQQQQMYPNQQQMFVNQQQQFMMQQQQLYNMQMQQNQAYGQQQQQFNSNPYQQQPFNQYQQQPFNSMGGMQQPPYQQQGMNNQQQFNNNQNNFQNKNM